MKRWLLFAVLSFPLVPAPASSAGLGLRWDSCLGDGAGAINRNFACDTNIGVERLVGSFVPPVDIPEVSGLEITMDILNAIPGTDGSGDPSNPLPAWWIFVNPGSCRQDALEVSFTTDQTNSVCRPWISRPALGGIAAYWLGFIGPGSARVLLGVAGLSGATGAVANGLEYFAFSLTISHANTVGAGACSGCAEPMALLFSSLKIAVPPLAGQQQWRSIWLSGPASFGGDIASWQGFRSPVAARATTWGAVKALYR
jgi:hypothetical protein